MKRRFLFCPAIVLAGLISVPLIADELEDLSAGGQPFYQQRCALCHDDPEDYVPPKAQLELRSADYVINALTKGSMYPHAEGLDPDEVKSIAVYVTGKLPTGVTINPDWKLNACNRAPAPLTADNLHWNGWGRDVNNSRFQPKPGFTAADVKNLKVKWTFAYPNGRHNSQPIYVGEQVLVSAAPGRVYSLDAKTGCTHWVYDPDAGVRATLSVGAIPDSNPTQYAVFLGTTDRFVHAVDAQTGERLWKTQVGVLDEARVTGAPKIYQDKLYVPMSSFEETAAVNPKYICCRFRGNVVALDIKTGKIDWRAYAIDEEPKQHKVNRNNIPMMGPAGAAIWSSPTIDEENDVVYAATGDSYTDVDEDGSDAVIAIERSTGKVLWKNQVTDGDNFVVGCFGRGAGHPNCPENLGPDVDFGSSTIVRKVGDKTVVLAGQKSGVLYAMDAQDKGKILWQTKLGQGSVLGGIQWGFSADDKVAYVAISDTAVFQERKPGLNAVDIATGKLLWHTPAKPCPGRCGNGLSAAISTMPGVVFAADMDGILRGYSAETGKIIWEFDTTANPYQSVNGLIVQGGSINATGPTIANGMLLINSGYGGVMNAGRGVSGSGAAMGQDGNVLLAFEVEK